MKRKLLSLLMVLAMVFTLLPTAAFAAEGGVIPVLVQDGMKFRMENGGAYVVELTDKTLTDITIPSQFADVCQRGGHRRGRIQGHEHHLRYHPRDGD